MMPLELTNLFFCDLASGKEKNMSKEGERGKKEAARKIKKETEWSEFLQCCHNVRRLEENGGAVQESPKNSQKIPTGKVCCEYSVNAQGIDED